MLSAVGDVALLWDSNRAFMVGLAAFLLAHIAYVIAFLGVAVWSPHVAVVAVIVTASSLLLLRATWKGAAGLHAATIAYAVVISAMVVTAWATIGGPLAMAPVAAVGAVLFYISDSSLALNRFRTPDPAHRDAGDRRLLARSARHRDRGVRGLLRAVGRVGPQRARVDARDRRPRRKRKKWILSSSGFIQPTVMQ